jgi:hypothetical protein
VIGSKHPGRGYAAYLPLAHGGLRGRFSPPAARFHVIVPLVLGVVMLITLGRGLAVFGPAFQAVRSRASGLAQSVDRAHQDAGPDPTHDLVSPVFTPEVQRWAPAIRRWSVEYSIPADLIAVVMQIESCGDPLAVSPSGAIGLFQVMPYHFSPEDDPFSAETNASRGLTYLAKGLSLAANEPGLALAGYNGGHGVIGLPERQWANETLRYVDWGVGILQEARAGLTSSPTLAAWLASGGRSLCRQAAQHGVALQSQEG